MGKVNSTLNLPANSSASMTLKSLCTLVEADVTSRAAGDGNASAIEWISEAPLSSSFVLSSRPHVLVPQLKDQDISRMIRHIERVKKLLPEVFRRSGGDTGSRDRNSDWAELRMRKDDLHFRIRTANTFPASSGIASSASSFAAVTLMTAIAYSEDPVLFQKVWDQNPGLKRELAKISRQGSGSSCRSFEGPWVEWDHENAFQMNSSAMPEMAHFVLLFRTEPKKTSSSDAHQQVLGSPLWQGRIERATERVQKLREYLKQGDLPSIARLVWAESWEMHSLFHTCPEPFSYWEPGTMEGLQWLSGYLRESAPPIVTLDAGPNIHIIVDKKDREMWRTRIKQRFSDLVVLEDEQGAGASILSLEQGAF
jgi:diphosphomevalonate decarboxylase